MNTVFFENPEEAQAWDMYVAAVISYEGWSEDSFGYMADAMILERRKRMAPEKVEREWIAHKLGDPMPCDAGANIWVRIRDGSTLYGTTCSFRWSEIRSNPSGEILEWRPA